MAETADITYSRLFNTRITHTFYEGGISQNDLAVVPTNETMLAMKNSKMLFRQDDEGFRILYKSDSLGTAFISFSNVRLVFSLQLLNVMEFLNFTNLDDVVNINPYSAGKILYFTNIGSTNVNDLSYSLIDYLRPVTFTYQFPQTAILPAIDYGNIIIKDQIGNIVTPVYPVPTNIVPDTSNHYSYPIDFTKLPKGLYKFETWTTNSPTHIFETIYIDNELASQGVFGVVDILAIDENAANYPLIPGVQPSPPVPPITDIRVYDMNFVRRQTQWKYIVVLKSGSIIPTDTIGIVDDNVQSPYGLLQFGTPTDTTVDGIPAKIIISNSTTIPYFETPKKSLNIKKDPLTSPVVVLSDIQGPPLGVVSADATNLSITEIFVFI
jgi:hypothetical protein